MSELFKRSAVDVNTNFQNGKSVDIAITSRGSDFYFGVCGVMAFVGLAVAGSANLKPRTDRVFFYITAAINLTAAVAYFAMGSNLGWTPIDVEFQRSDSKVAGINREIFYARYIDWFITTPLLISDLLLTAGVPWPTIVWTIFLDWLMIVTGLIGALIKTRYKWGFYAFGCFAMFVIFWNIGWEGRKRARLLGSDVSRVYLACGVWTLLIWLLYPIAWGLSEGGNVIAPDSEAVFYGVLDLCAKPFFSIALIFGHWRIDPARMGLRLRDYDEEPHYLSGPHRGGIDEKARGTTDGVVHPETAPATGATNGHTTTTEAQPTV